MSILTGENLFAEWKKMQQEYCGGPKDPETVAEKKKIDKKKRNAMAKQLRDPKFRQQVVKAKKGKGSYSRKEQEMPEAWYGTRRPKKTYKVTSKKTKLPPSTDGTVRDKYIKKGLIKP